ALRCERPGGRLCSLPLNCFAFPSEQNEMRPRCFEPAGASACSGAGSGLALADALRDQPRYLDGVPNQGLPVRSGNLAAARKAAGIHPVFKRGAVVTEPERFKFGVAQIPAAEIPRAKKLRDQRVIDVELRLHRRFYGTF